MPTDTGFRLITSETRPLTKELAHEFRDLEPSPTERDLNPKRVKFLKEKAEAGLLVTFGWACAKIGNKVVRMNGQHSSNMLCELNGSFPDGLKVHLDEYEVKDGNGLANLFRQFDARQSGRTAGDVAGAYQGLFEPLHEVPKAVAKLGAEGIAWWNKNVQGGPYGKGDDAYQVFADPKAHAFLRWMGELFSSKTPEMKKVPVVAALYATHVANPHEAVPFWQKVARGGDEYAEDAPSTVLDAWLKGAHETETDIKPGHLYQGCIYGWNAHRDGKTIKAIKFDTGKGYHQITE